MVRKSILERSKEIASGIAVGLLEKTMASGRNIKLPDNVRLPSAINEPKPTKGKADILPLVLADLQSRADMGKEKYGTLLQSHNGRDALNDAYQEALDLAMYLRQLIEERNG